MRRLMLLVALVTGLVAIGQTVAVAGKPSGGGGTTSCGTGAPTADVATNYAWGQSGAWGMPGQKVNFAVDVMNHQGCSASMTMTLSAPAGWTVSTPTTVTVPANSDAYAWGTITSPATATAGTYAIGATVRASSGTATASSVYMVYTSDTTPPTIFWTAPANGSHVTGKTVGVGFDVQDDHAMARASLAIDGTTVVTVDCTMDVSYDCPVNYNWSTSRVSGTHTATFTASDHVGNTSRVVSTFTVN